MIDRSPSPSFIRLATLLLDEVEVQEVPDDLLIWCNLAHMINPFFDGTSLQGVALQIGIWAELRRETIIAPNRAPAFAFDYKKGILLDYPELAR